MKGDYYDYVEKIIYNIGRIDIFIIHLLENIFILQMWY